LSPEIQVIAPIAVPSRSSAANFVQGGSNAAGPDHLQNIGPQCGVKSLIVFDFVRIEPDDRAVTLILPAGTIRPTEASEFASGAGIFLRNLHGYFHRSMFDKRRELWELEGEMIISPESAIEPFASQNHRRAAFTLTEVVLALGVMSVAFLPLMGLLPVGMDTFRSSVDRSAAARVIERLANEARQSDFDTVSSSTGDLYFDEQGSRTDDRQSAVFEAKVTVLDEDFHLKRLVIQVARNPGGTLDLTQGAANGAWSGSGARAVTTGSVLLARLSSE